MTVVSTLLLMVMTMMMRVMMLRVVVMVMVMQIVSLIPNCFTLILGLTLVTVMMVVVMRMMRMRVMMMMSGVTHLWPIAICLNRGYWSCLADVNLCCLILRCAVPFT